MLFATPNLRIQFLFFVLMSFTISALHASFGESPMFEYSLPSPPLRQLTPDDSEVFSATPPEFDRSFPSPPLRQEDPFGHDFSPPRPGSPTSLADVLKESLPEFFTTDEGKKNYMNQAIVCTMIQELQKIFLDPVIKDILSLAAQYPRQLMASPLLSQQPFHFDELTELINTLGGISCQYPTSLSVAYRIMLDQTKKDRLPNWKDRQKCLNLSAQLLWEIVHTEGYSPDSKENSPETLKTKKIIDVVYTLAPPRTSAENLWQLALQIKHFQELRPRDYEADLQEFLSKHPHFTSSKDWISFFQGYIYATGQKGTLSLPDLVPSSEVSLPLLEDQPSSYESSFDISIQSLDASPKKPKAAPDESFYPWSPSLPV